MAAVRTWSGARLRALREHKGLTQEEFARLVPTSLTNVSRWERGKVIPGANMLVVLADRLEVAMEELYENGKEVA